MLSIGEFAQLTGLTVKALRLYDRQGALEPASIDRSSGYRRYKASQVPAAIRLKALRAAGVSVADASWALGSPARTSAVLATHREKVVAARVRQDSALDALDSLLEAEERTWEVTERRVGHRYWAGVRVRVRDEGEKTGERDSGEPGEENGGEDHVNQAFGTLWKALAEDNNTPTGPFWWSMRDSGAENMVELLCCWPIERPLPQDWSLPGLAVESGQLGGGVELVAAWRHDEMVPSVEDTPHPAIVALLTQAEARGIDVDLSKMRQLGLIEDGESVGFEVALPVRR